MDTKIFNVLQDTIAINAVSATVTHPHAYSENGYKSQYDLWLLTSGSLQITYDSTTYKLEKGDLFLMYPNVLYQAQVLSHEGLSLIYTHFSYTINQSPFILNNFPLSGHLPFTTYKKTELNKVVTDFIQSFKEKKEDRFLSAFFNKQYFYILISKFIESKLTNDQTRPVIQASYPKLSRLLPLIEYIHDNYNQKLSGSTLASIVDMSEKHFITFFKSTLGLTPHQYQIQLRMQKAVTLLSAQQYTIKEIADTLGYKDQYNFSTAFKKHYGVSPSKYLDNGFYK